MIKNKEEVKICGTIVEINKTRQERSGAEIETGGVEIEISGAELVVHALKKEKVSHLFAYPGGQAIDLFDAIYCQAELEVILPRHEQGLIHAADGYARSTGEVGVCLVTSGPGATNLVTGIATANSDSVPLVCFTGQVPTTLMGDDSFQEVDIVAITKSICKYAVTVRDRKELGSILQRAFQIARCGRPGVVVIDLPKDIQQALGSGRYSTIEEDYEQQKTRDSNSSDQKQFLQLLSKSERPVILAGGGVLISKAQSELTCFAKRCEIPVITTMMGKGSIITSDPLYLGNLGIHGSYAANTAISQCDLLISLGVRFNDRITGKTDEFASGARIISINIEPESISRNVKLDLSIAADVKNFLRELPEELPCQRIQPWRDRTIQWKASYPIVMKNSKMTPQNILEAINRMFPEVIVVTDVGQNQLWTTQFLELNERRKMLTSGGMGTMGYGLPAGLGAKIGNPETDVLIITGDGGMQMNLQEMATAIVYELPVIICIFNNGYLGNVRQWQELYFQKRYSSTCLRYRKKCTQGCNTPGCECPAYTPDFVKLAESYGACGIRVKQKEEIEDAFRVAKSNKKIPTLIEFLIEPGANVLPIVPTGNPLHEMIMD